MNKFHRKLTKGLHSNFEHAAATAFHMDQADNNLLLEYIATHDSGAFCALLEQNLKYTG